MGVALSSLLLLSATKQGESSGSIIPTQRRYQQWWAKAKAGLPY